ncbi:MAG: tetratricopeptide repeat protein, partial [Candidatus Auribacterota bacterium]|nr:tetratricopeptide repeat protein [Candidatus Auribacterota bacterium]
FVFLASLFIHNIQSYDLWWHLETGEYILKNLSIPGTDPYSYTASRDWIDLQWIFQVVIFLIEHNLGLNALIIFKSLVLLAAFFILFKTIYTPKRYLSAIILTFLAALCCRQRAVLRPEIFTFLYITIFLYILHRYKYGSPEGKNRFRQNYIFILPAVQLLWVNSHGLFILGVVLVWSFIAGEFISRRLNLPILKDEHVIKGLPYRKLLLAGLLVILCSFINPYTYQGAIFPFTLLTRISGSIPVFSRTIGEFQPPLSNFAQDNTIIFYKLLLALSALTLLLNIRRLSLSHLLLYVIFAYLSLLARRNIAIFALVSAPIMAANIARITGGGRKLLPGPEKRWRRVGEIITAIIILFCLYDLLTDGDNIRDNQEINFGLGVARLKFPEKAAVFVRKSGIKGNIFNTLQCGNYLIRSFYPERKIFMDGRLEIRSSDFYKKYVRLLGNPARWSAWQKKYNFSYAIFSPRDADMDKLLVYLYNQPDWKLVFMDDSSVVFAGDNPVNRDIINRYEVDIETADFPSLEDISGFSDWKVSEIYLQRGNFFGKLGQLEKARKNYTKALLSAPFEELVHINMGIILSRQKRYQEAMREYRMALAGNPDSSLAHFNLGNLYHQQGKITPAVGEYIKSINGERIMPAAYYNLAGIYLEQNRLAEAADLYRKLLKIQSWSLNTRLNFGVVLARQGLKK